MRLMDIEKAMKNPSATFGTPEALYSSTELTAEQKEAVLRQWQDQLEQLQAADDESMQAPGGRTSGTADFLQRVTTLLSELAAHS